MGLTVGSLFAGIGGLDLGAERAGLEVVWQCEKDDYCTKILNKNWPNTPVFNDVRTIYTDDGPTPEEPDILCGGFPCQDISIAKVNGKGLDGSKSGLWWEMFRIIRRVRPRYAVIENVAEIRVRGLDGILAALAQIGYDAEWQSLPAGGFGAPHERERVFIVAYPQRERLQGSVRRRQGVCLTERTTSAQLGDETVSCGGWWGNHIEDVRETCEGVRVGNGVPRPVDEIKALGNAVVPEVAEFVFDCIKQHYNE